MAMELYSCRKNRGQVAKDVSRLLAVKNISAIRVARKPDGIYVYAGGDEE